MGSLTSALESAIAIKNQIKSAIESKGGTVTNFASYPSAIRNLPSVNIPDGIKFAYSTATSIPTALIEGAFGGTTNRHMDYAFYKCTNLTSINLTRAQNILGLSNAFRDCASLTVLNLGSYSDFNGNLITGSTSGTLSMLTITNYALTGCTSLKTLYLPGEMPILTNVYHMFDNCTALENIYFGPKTLSAELTTTIGSIVSSTVINLSWIGLSYCMNLTTRCLANFIRLLPARSSATTLKIGTTNLTKLTTALKTIARNKNYTLS